MSSRMASMSLRRCCGPQRLADSAFDRTERRHLAVLMVGAQTGRGGSDGLPIEVQVDNARST